MDNKKTMEKAKKLGFQGDSNTEALAWVNAVEKGLDMSQEARYERARNMGFNTEDTYYHGTKYEFDRFDKSKIGLNYTYSEDSGFFFTKKKRTAENYAFIHSKEEGGRVITAFLKFENPYVTSTNSEYYQPSDRFDISGSDMMHEVRVEKKDAIVIKGTRNDDICVVLEPSQILSIYAAFDPETESYKPKMDLEETLEEFMIDYNLSKGEGLTELNRIISEYCLQENKSKEQVLLDIHEAVNIDYYHKNHIDYAEKIKKHFNNAVLNNYNKPTKPKKSNRKTLRNR